MYSRIRQTGFTLIELMIAMVLGLLVVGATIALAVSLMRSNNETVRATRLTQELRGLADVLTAEARRARGIKDPLANVGVGAAAFTTCNAIYPAVADGTKQCLLFAYDCNPVDGSGTFVAFNMTGGNLKRGIGTTCASADKQLNSAGIVISTANFSSTANGSVKMTLTAYASSDASFSRTVTRTIYPRSVPVAP